MSFLLRFLKNPKILLPIIGMLIMAGAYYVGYRHARANCEADKKAAVEAALKDYQHRQNVANQIASELEARDRQIEVVYRTIEKEVVKYVESHKNLEQCTLDDDGLRLWNRANAGRLRDESGSGESDSGDQ